MLSMDALAPTGHWIAKPLDCKATRLQTIPFQTCKLSHTGAEKAAREAVLKDLAVAKEFELKEKADRDGARGACTPAAGCAVGAKKGPQQCRSQHGGPLEQHPGKTSAEAAHCKN